MSKIALVTGANKGIGFEIVKQLAERDFKVILTARNNERGEEARKKINSDNVVFHRLDMNDADSFEKIAAYIETDFGHLDVLINNAGIMSQRNGFDQASLENIRTVMETNLFGPIALTQALLALIKKSSDGRIINISSGMGALNDAGSGYAGYRLSKVSLNGFSAFLARDLSGTKIKVNTMCPGWVRTDMGGSNASRSVDKGAETAVWLATASEIPNGKFLRDKRVIDW